jgi:hypothetical protein
MKIMGVVAASLNNYFLLLLYVLIVVVAIVVLYMVFTWSLFPFIAFFTDEITLGVLKVVNGLALILGVLLAYGDAKN